MKNEITDDNKKTEKLTVSQAEFLFNLPRFGYNISKTCEELNIPRSKFKKWKKQSALFHDKLIELQDALIDNAEESLHHLAKVERNFNAIKYVLDHIGKKRGWGDQKNTGKKQNYPQMTFYCENILLGRDKNGLVIEPPTIDISKEDNAD